MILVTGRTSTFAGKVCLKYYTQAVLSRGLPATATLPA
jgi:hypothetical protein